MQRWKKGIEMPRMRTARERREREVERMAKRLMRVAGHRGDHGWRWDTAPSVVQKVYVDSARYVLRLLAAERRKAFRDGYQQATFDMEMGGQT